MTANAQGYTRGEELANVATHALGALLSVAGLGALVWLAAASRDGGTSRKSPDRRSASSIRSTCDRRSGAPSPRRR